MKLFISIDLGTSPVKLLLVDETGSIVNEVTKDYSLYCPQLGWSEQEPADWWKAVQHGILQLTEYVDKSEIRGIGCGGRCTGEKLKAPRAAVKRIGDLDFFVSVEPSDDVLGYNILWGHRPDKLYHSYLMMSADVKEKRVGALVNGQACYVRVLAFKENGIMQGNCIQLSK